MRSEKMIDSGVVEKNEELKFFLYLKLSRLFLKLNEFDRAIKYLELSILIKPRYLLSYIWLAEAYDLNYETDSAIDVYDKALKCKTTIPDKMKIYIETERNYLIARGPRKKGLRHATYIIG
jgi:tetratricopeptide (TPR) repeat protein